MNEKINLGEVTIEEFNLIMKQLSTGQLGECINLFMRFRQIADDFQRSQMQPPVQLPESE